jgi:hypothetical protein
MASVHEGDAIAAWSCNNVGAVIAGVVVCALRVVMIEGGEKQRVGTCHDGES